MLQSSSEACKASSFSASQICEYHHNVTPANIFAKEQAANPAASYLHSHGQLLIRCSHTTCTSYLSKTYTRCSGLEDQSIEHKLGGAHPALALCEHAKRTNPSLLLLLSFASSLWANFQILRAPIIKAISNSQHATCSTILINTFQISNTMQERTSVQPCTPLEAHCPCTLQGRRL